MSNSSSVRAISRLVVLLIAPLLVFVGVSFGGSMGSQPADQAKADIGVSSLTYVWTPGNPGPVKIRVNVVTLSDNDKVNRMLSPGAPKAGYFGVFDYESIMGFWIPATWCAEVSTDGGPFLEQCATSDTYRFLESGTTNLLRFSDRRLF